MGGSGLPIPPGGGLPLFPRTPQTLADLGRLLGLPEKRQVFISYHHHGDQYYKNELSRLYCDSYELLEDNSLDRIIDTDNLQYVEREIREDYIKGASVTVVLCGAQTYQRKFVDWEVYATLLKQAGLVGVRLPYCGAVPWRLFDNWQTGYAVVGDWNALLAAPGALRVWIEQALAKSKALIDNRRPKMRRNGEEQPHPGYGR